MIPQFSTIFEQNNKGFPEKRNINVKKGTLKMELGIDYVEEWLLCINLATLQLFNALKKKDILFLVQLVLSFEQKKQGFYKKKLLFK